MTVYYIFVLIIGLMIGSFLNVCIYRLPKQESLVVPRSRCTACGNTLKPLDLIPVFSFIFQRGKCRYCGNKISYRYIIVEVITAFIYLLLLNRFGLTIDFLAAVFIMTILIVVLFIDYEHRIIPDELVLTGLAGGVVLIIYNLFERVMIFGDRQWYNPVIGTFTGSGILLLVAIIGYFIYKSDDAMGMGDVKIFAPIGMFLGWRMTIIALVLSIFLGGIIGLLLILFKIKKRKDAVPFGPFIVISVFITQMCGWELYNWYLNRL